MNTTRRSFLKTLSGMIGLAAVCPEKAAQAIENIKIAPICEPIIPTYINKCHSNVIPENKTRMIKWCRYDALHPVTKPLVEGECVTSDKLRLTKIPDLEDYGRSIDVTDIINEVESNCQAWRDRLERL